MASKSKAGSSRYYGLHDTGIIVLQALAIAFFVRLFFYQPFNIPSGSMKETLLVGDYLFVSKLSYGYSRYSLPFGYNYFSGRIFAAEPERGDVVVFKLPRDNSTDYIKRVIGLPGDTIEMRSGVLHINGTAVPKVAKGSFTTVDDDGSRIEIPSFTETLPNGRSYTVLDAEQNGMFDNAGPFTVPDGHFFMMGDNRDNSTDSRAQRAVGFVPFENLVGRAEIIFFSAAIDEPDAFRWTSPWTWPFDIRWNRIFNLVR
jgi:signal peptidase I